MPIDFSILKPIQGGSIGGSIPAINPRAEVSPMDSLAGGLAEGIKAGQGMKLQQQQSEMNALKLKDANEDYGRKQEILAAAKQSQDKYFEVLKQNAPDQYLEQMKTIADTKRLNAETAVQLSKNKGEEANNYNNIAITQANIVNSAHQAEQRQPGAGQQVYSTARKMAGSIGQTMPEEFTPNTLMTYTSIATDIALQKSQEEALKSASPTRKMQIERNQLQGNADPAQDIAELNSKINSDNKQYRPASEEIGIKVAQDRLQKDNDDARTHRSNLETARTMSAISDKTDSGTLAEYKTKLNNLASSALGMKLDPKTPLNETFMAVSTQFTVDLQSLMKGQTSDRDMKLMAQAGPQLTNTAQGKKLLAKMIEYRANGGLNQISFENAWVAKHGSVNGMDDAWSSFVNSRQDIKVNKNGTLDFNMYSKDDWKPYLDPDYKGGNKSTSSDFIDGQVYKDANGNQARYVNGQWESI